MNGAQRDERPDIRDVRRLYDIRSVLGMDSRKSKIICPLPEHIHSNNTPSFHIYQNRDGYQKWHCFGNCSKWGDVIDLKGYMEIYNYDPQDIEMVRKAIALLTNSHEIEVVIPVIKKDVLPPGLWRDYLPPGPEVMAYAAKRGLNYDTVVKFKLGQYRSFMEIPIFEERTLKMIKFRNTKAGIRFFTAEGSQKSLFNYDAVAYTEDPVLILKGEIPVMLADQYGLLACAPSSGEASFVDQWKHLLAFSSKKVVVGDNDRDPKVREKMQALAAERAHILSAELHFPPEQHKDWDEWVLAEPDIAIPTTKEWLE